MHGTVNIKLIMLVQIKIIYTSNQMHRRSLRATWLWDLKVLIMTYLLGGEGAPDPLSQGLLIHEVSRSHTTTHQSRYNSSGRVISSSHLPLPDNTQHSKQTDFHSSCRIRTHSLNRRAAPDLPLRPRGHWDRRLWLT